MSFKVFVAGSSAHLRSRRGEGGREGEGERDRTGYPGVCRSGLSCTGASSMADSPARSLIPLPGSAMLLLAPRTAASRPAFCNLPAGPAGHIGGLRGRDVGLAQGFRPSTLLLCHGHAHLGNRAPVAASASRCTHCARLACRGSLARPLGPHVSNCSLGFISHVPAWSRFLDSSCRISHRGRGVFKMKRRRKLHLELVHS